MMVNSRGKLSKIEIQTALLTENTSKIVLHKLRKYPLIQNALQPSNLSISMLDLDKGGGSEVQLNEWYEWMDTIEKKEIEEKKRIQAYQHLFDTMDLNNDGNLDRKEIRKTLMRYPERTSNILKKCKYVSIALAPSNLKKSFMEMEYMMDSMDDKNRMKKTECDNKSITTTEIRTSINLKEWMVWCKGLHEKGMKQEKRLLSLRALFHSIDVKGKGWLKPKEVLSSLSKFPKATNELLNEYPIIHDALLPKNIVNTMNEMDQDGNTRVDINEWMNWFELIRLEKLEKERRRLKMYDLFYYVIDTDNSWTVNRNEIRIALINNEVILKDMLKLYPFILNALNPVNLENSLKELIPSSTKINKLNNNSNNNSSNNNNYNNTDTLKNDDVDSTSSGEEDDGDNITFNEFLVWVEKLYTKSKRYKKVDHQMKILFHQIDTDRSNTLSKHEIRKYIMDYPNQVQLLLSNFPNVHGLLHPKCLSISLKILPTNNITLSEFQEWIRKMEDKERDTQKRFKMYDILYTNILQKSNGSSNGISMMTMKKRFIKKKKRIMKLITRTSSSLKDTSINLSFFMNILYNTDKKRKYMFKNMFFSMNDDSQHTNINKECFINRMECIYKNHIIQLKKEKALTSLFYSLDIDGGGTLTKEEITETLSKISFSQKNEMEKREIIIKDGHEVYSMKSALSRFPILMSCLHPRNFDKSMLSLDRDGDGEITLNEFLSWIEYIERDAIEKSKYIPPLEKIYHLEESSIYGLWKIWKEHFIPTDKNEEEPEFDELEVDGLEKEKRDYSNHGQFIRYILHKLRRDLTFKKSLRNVLPVEVFDGIRQHLLNVLVPSSWSRFRRQKRIEFGKVTLYDFIIAVDTAVHQQQKINKKEKLLPVK